MTLKLYYDLISQPSRAVFIFLKCNNIAFEPKALALRKGEQFSNEFKQINRFQKVPAIDDNGFKLIESIAILRYLSREKSVDDHWFPKNSKKQARVDEYLAWQHHNTRWMCHFYFDRKYLMPLKTGKPTSEDLIEEAKDRMLDCFEKIENFWLKNDFIAGDEISLADLVAACEIEQIRSGELELGKDFPKIIEWLDRVRSKLNPHYDEAHSIVYRMAEKSKGKN